MRTGLFMLLLLLAESAFGVHVVFHFTSSNTDPQGIRSLALYPYGPSTNGNGVIITRDRMMGITDTNGDITISNLYGGATLGFYRGELRGTFTTTTNWYSFPDTNGLVVAANYTTNIPGFTTPFTLSAADNRYIQIAGGNGANVTNYNATNLDIGIHTFYLTTDVDPSAVIGQSPAAGNSYILAPGTYTCANWFKIPTNGSVTGPGAILVNNYQPGLPAALINPSDNSQLVGVVVSNNAAESTFGACVGFYSAVSGMTPYTNFVARNVTLYGSSDTFYNRFNGAKIQCELWNSKLYGGWDILAMFDAGTNNIDFYGCKFIHIGASAHGNASDVAVASGNPTCLIRYYGCDFYMSNSLNSSDYLWQAQDSSASVEAVEYYNCTYTNLTPKAFPPILIAQAGQAIPKIINCNFPANSVGRDDITGYPTRIDPVVTTNLTFGGDWGNGVGPQIFQSGGLGGLTLNHTATSNNFSGLVKAANLSAGSITNTGLTASRPVVTDANKALASGTGSGSVPVNADGSATTVAQMETLMLATNDTRYIKRQAYKRLTLIQANGATSTIIGDQINNGGGDTPSAVAPTSTEGELRRQTSDTTNPHDTGVSGNLMYRSGRNIYFGSTVKIDSTATKRYFFGVTDQTIITMGGADDAVGNYAGFLLTTNQAKILTVTKDNATQTSTTTTVNQDTSIHLYEVVFSDSTPNVIFKIDGNVVATHTTHLPSASTNMRYVVGGQKFDVANRTTDFEWIQVESDR